MTLRKLGTERVPGSPAQQCKPGAVLWNHTEGNYAEQHTYGIVSPPARAVFRAAPKVQFLLLPDVRAACGAPLCLQLACSRACLRQGLCKENFSPAHLAKVRDELPAELWAVAGLCFAGGGTAVLSPGSWSTVGRTRGIKSFSPFSC